MLHHRSYFATCLFAWAFTLAAVPAVASERADEPLKISLAFELGPDRGQNFGSLFEITDDGGQVVAGAGFCGAYNTQPRSDRGLLQVFVRVPGTERPWRVERLPVVDSPARGFYPFSVRGELYLVGRSGPDARVRRWDAAVANWLEAPDVPAYAEEVAGKTLAVTSTRVVYDGRVVFNRETGPERIGEHYFGGGNLLLRLYAPGAQSPVNRVDVYPWRPNVDALLPAQAVASFELTMPSEFVYAFGQWRDHVLLVSNYGRVLRYAQGEWGVLREPVQGVSYQIYSALSYYERLLLGHYPTGKIYAYAGEGLTLLDDWPPVPQGVSPNAREAQSLAIYGGDLVAGVWPWAEVWRYDRDREAWNLARRMFAHPPLTSEVVHPYEAETKAVDPVYNLWGQRVTGLQPSGTGLIITTSSKTGTAWEPRFSFLSPEQQADYGAVYRATQNGSLAVPIRWRPDRSELELTATAEMLEIKQDCVLLGSIPLDAELHGALRDGRIAWGSGVFGPFEGRLLEREASLSAKSEP